MSAPRYRWPGVKGVHLQHKEEFRDFDPQEFLDRIFFYSLLVTAIFVLAAVWVTR